MDKRRSELNIEGVRHTLAHVLAEAVLKKFPKAKLGIGPVIESGFYYDFLLLRPLSPDDLKEIEGEMRGIIKRGFKIVGKKVTPAEAKKLFKNPTFQI